MDEAVLSPDYKIAQPHEFNLDTLTTTIVNSAKQLELSKLTAGARAEETANALIEHRDQTAIVHSIEDLEDPLGKLGENLTLYFTSDFHHSPSDVKTGIRAQAFKGYGLQRRLEQIGDFLKQRKRFSGVEEDPLVLRHVIQEDVRNLFYDWMAKVIERDCSTDNETTPTIVSLGDMVTDGAFWQP